MAPTSIAVVEPQMSGFFHAPFNAAFLHAVVLAFPRAAVSFRALPDHAAAVRGILEEHDPAIINAIHWRTIRPLSTDSTAVPLLARWRANRGLLKQVLAPQERLIFSSISRLQLLQLKRLMKLRDQVFAVLHGDLDRIENPATERFPASLFSLQRILKQRNPAGLRFILLSRSIHDNIPSKFRSAFINAAVIDHPYHFPRFDASRPASLAQPTFGIFGNTGDGHLLERVARAVKAVNPDIVFRLVGFLSDNEAATRLQPLVEGVGQRPLSRDEFVARAYSIDYALWLAPVGSFRLRASGTFFDALAYGKPLVYVANPYIDSYFNNASEIGIRCESVEAVPEAILALATEHNADTYAAAQAAIGDLRQHFTPHSLSTHLPTALGWD